MSSRPTASKWTNHPSVSGNSAPKLPRCAASSKARQTGGEPTQVGSRKKPDSRVRRTRDALGDALIALMQERPFDSITIQHVLDRAKIGRSTFYNHFRDKDDLFLGDVDDFFALISSALDRRGDESDRLLPAREFFAHVADVQPFIRALRDAEKFRDVFELGKGHFARGIEARLATIPATRSLSPVSRAARSHALAGAFLSLLEWWLAHPKTATPEEMDSLFHQLAWRGLHGYSPMSGKTTRSSQERR